MRTLRYSITILFVVGMLAPTSVWANIGMSHVLHINHIPAILISQSSLSEYQAKVLSLNPSLYLTLDEESEDAVQDHSPNRLNVIPIGEPNLSTPGFFPEMSNSAMHLDGVDDCLEVSDDGTLDIRRQISLSLWVKVDSFHEGHTPLICKGGDRYGSMKERAYTLWLHETGFLHLITAGQSGQQGVVTRTGLIELAKWYHVVATIDRIAGEMVIYVNGKRVAIEDTETSDTLSHNQPLRIGSTNGYSFFHGEMDEIAVYEKVLTEWDVAALHDCVVGLHITDYDPYSVNAELAPLSSVAVTFSDTVDFEIDGSGSFWLDDITITGPSGAVAPTGIVELENNRFEISFPQQSVPGRYSIQIGPEISDTSGNRMDQNLNGTRGEGEEDAFRFSVHVIDYEESPSTSGHRMQLLSHKPVLYLPFDELVDDTVYDYSSYGLDGACVGNPNLTPDTLFGLDQGNALQFDGVDDYIEVNDDGSLDFRREISIALWVKIRSFGERDDQRQLFLPSGDN